jgi:hypothetical protein
MASRFGSGRATQSTRKRDRRRDQVSANDLDGVYWKVNPHRPRNASVRARDVCNHLVATAHDDTPIKAHWFNVG